MKRIIYKILLRTFALLASTTVTYARGANDELVGRLDSIVTTLPDGTNSIKQVYEYDEDYDQQNEKLYTWDGETWVLSKAYFYEWDKRDGKVFLTAHEEFNYTSDDTYIGARLEYTYDANDFVASEIKISVENGNRTPEIKNTYVNDDKGNILEAYQYIYDGADWQVHSKESTAYDDHDRIVEHESYEWNGGWVGTGKEKYKYDPLSGNLILAEMPAWSNTDWDWVDHAKTMYEYNAENLLILSADSLYQDETWTIAVKKAITYTPVTGEDGFFEYERKTSYDVSGSMEQRETLKYKYYIAEESFAPVVEHELLPANSVVTYAYEYNTQTLEGFEKHYTYNNLNLIEMKGYVYETGTGNKLASEWVFMKYDGNKNNTEQINMGGDGTEDGWAYTTKFQYEYGRDNINIRTYAYKYRERWVKDYGSGLDMDYNVLVSQLIVNFGYDNPYKIPYQYTYENDGNDEWATSVRTFYYTPLGEEPKKGQTITFPALADAEVGDSDFSPGATASSGLTVSYTSSNTGVATIVNGKIHIVGVGTTTITATQAGNDEYEAATPVSRDLKVNGISETIDYTLYFGNGSNGWSLYTDVALTTQYTENTDTWSATANTLTLDGFEFETTADKGLSLCDAATLVITDGSTNTIALDNQSTTSFRTALYAEGDLTIMGGSLNTGVLNINASGGTATTGIEAYYNATTPTLIMDGITININIEGNAGVNQTGISNRPSTASNGSQTIFRNGARLIACISGTNTAGLYIYDLTIDADSWVELSATMVAAAIDSEGSVDLDEVLILEGTEDGSKEDLLPVAFSEGKFVIEGTESQAKYLLIKKESTAVTGVNLNKTTLALAVEATEQLTATVLPENADNKNVTWSSSNETVASVSETGLVTAIAEGTATITVTTEDGQHTDSCKLTVSTNVSIANIKEIVLNIYPNPATDVLYIESSAVVESVFIYNMNGTIVLQQDKPGNRINVSSLPQGVYLMKITTIQGETVRKFIKQ